MLLSGRRRAVFLQKIAYFLTRYMRLNSRRSILLNLIYTTMQRSRVRLVFVKKGATHQRALSMLKPNKFPIKLVMWYNFHRMMIISSQTWTEAVEGKALRTPSR